jgi:hypothetical protein
VIETVARGLEARWPQSRRRRACRAAAGRAALGSVGHR